MFAGLAGAGTVEQAGLGFTLESAKAREKLQEFALAQPDYYQLLAVAGLYALGCRQLVVTVDADDFILRGEKPLSREPFSDLWSFVSRGSSESLVTGCRLLALALLTSVRLDKMLWKIQSSDAGGGWEQTVTVSRGVLSETAPVFCSTAPEGVLFWAKRKAIGQVVRRYLKSWWKGDSYPGSEKELLQTRLFLPSGASLSYNGSPLLEDGVVKGKAWAVLETGQASSLIDGPLVYRLQRDYSLCTALCPPGSENDSELPGEGGRAVWIWNGLRMDSTALGGELSCVRAFVWAPELTPDLSFTSLVDNRAKQALERNVRSLAREMLDRWVRALSQEIRAQESPDPGAFQERLAVVKAVIAERIDTRKNWKRLASLNRALVECPLLLGSGPDGICRWITMEEIQNEFLAGREVAAFEAESSPPVVPPWPDRPLVLYTVEQEWQFLMSRFRGFAWRKGRAVLTQLERLSAIPKESPSGSARKALLCGRVRVDEHELSWDWLEETEKVKPENSGSLRVRRPNGQCFVDTTLGLPSGVHARVEADWAPSFHGRLVDEKLASRVRKALWDGLAVALAESHSCPPSQRDRQLSGLLAACLSEKVVGATFSASWLVVSNLQGEQCSISPQRLDHVLQEQDAPLFVTDQTEAFPFAVAAQWPELQVVLAPVKAESGLKVVLGRPTRSMNAWSRLGAKSVRHSPHELSPLMTMTLEPKRATSLSSALRSVTMGIRRPGDGGGTASETSLETRLRGYRISQKKVRGYYPGLWLTVDWQQGWPDASASQIVGGLEDEQAQEIVKKACLELAADFFRVVGSGEEGGGGAVLQAVSPELLGTWMFDLLSEPATASLPLFCLADGRWVSLTELSEQGGVATYFRVFPEKPELLAPGSVYLPQPIAETIGLFCELNWVEEVPQKSSAELTPKPSAIGIKQVLPPKEQGRQLMETPAEPSPLPPKSEPSPQMKPVSEPTPQPRIPMPSELSAKPASHGVIPTQRRESRWSEATHSEALQEELLAVTAHQSLGFGEFAEFLSQVHWDSSRKTLFSYDSGLTIMGKPAVTLSQSRDGRLMLLSALFSSFHRQNSAADDQLERIFHQLITIRALDSGLNVHRPSK